MDGGRRVSWMGAGGCGGGGAVGMDLVTEVDAICFLTQVEAASAAREHGVAGGGRNTGAYQQRTPQQVDGFLRNSCG